VDQHVAMVRQWNLRSLAKKCDTFTDSPASSWLAG
jgi:hypothetical protein